MSEIRNKVEGDWAYTLGQRRVIREFVDIGSLIEVLLAHPNIAIVDRGAELPQAPIKLIDEMVKDHLYRSPYVLAQQDMLKEGWVKEIKDD